jgi:DNA-binding CsgD family transcriptional regulator
LGKSEGVLTARESIFVALVSTELAYKEVAELMNVEEKPFKLCLLEYRKN